MITAILVNKDQYKRNFFITFLKFNYDFQQFLTTNLKICSRLKNHFLDLIVCWIAKKRCKIVVKWFPFYAQWESFLKALFHLPIRHTLSFHEKRERENVSVALYLIISKCTNRINNSCNVGIVMRIKYQEDQMTKIYLKVYHLLPQKYVCNIYF